MDEVDEIPSSGWLKGCANLKITKCVRGTTSIQENAGFAAIRAKRSRAADGFAASLKPVIAEIRAKGAKRRRSPKRCVSHADLIYADLSEANLTEANLSHANLSRAYLIGADLRGAYLSDASLRDTDLSSGILIGAHLSSADLSGGNISGANLIDADLHNADLRDANLDNANLTSTDLNGADLSGANLANARLSETVFADSNLTGVVGLEACFHFGPSVIDHRTMQKSRSLPTPFLRGVGLPERLIDYLPTLLAQAIQYYSCFISYSTKDQEFADRIYADLQSRGVRCWFAPHDLPIGGKYATRSTPLSGCETSYC